MPVYLVQHGRAYPETHDPDRPLTSLAINALSIARSRVGRNRPARARTARSSRARKPGFSSARPRSRASAFSSLSGKYPA